MLERLFDIYDRDGLVTTVKASGYYGACLACCEAMGLDSSVIRGTTRMKLPGGTNLYVVGRPT
jgi:hypothetical protein